MKDVLRTPEKYFSNLPGFPYGQKYNDDLQRSKGMRIHYIDEGPLDAENVFLCLHGEPTWSYLYRKMIPVFLSGGHRVVAPDFFGFGRSDKPTEENIYTFNFHRESIISLIEHLDLNNITLVCQDWGGIIGLTLPMDMKERFSHLLIMDTILATGDIQLSSGFLDWRAWNNTRPDMNVGRLMSLTCPQLTPEECAAYDAPFPDITYKAGVRRFPNIVPDNPDMEGASLSQRARKFLSDEWDGEVFMAIGMNDPVLGTEMMYPLSKIIRNCPKPYEVKEAGHFMQEWGENIAKKALKSFNM